MSITTKRIYTEKVGRMEKYDLNTGSREMQYEWGHTKQSVEILGWNGDHLKSITKHSYYYAYGSFEYENLEIAQFFYNNNKKISTIRIGSHRYELLYQNDFLSSVICYNSNDNPTLEYLYEYNGNLLTKISLSVPSYDLLEEYYFEWLEGNVAQIKYYNKGDYVSSYTFMYDNKENPFFNLCVNFHDNLQDPDCFYRKISHAYFKKQCNIRQS